jgi:hypothetical protein
MLYFFSLINATLGCVLVQPFSKGWFLVQPFSKGCVLVQPFSKGWFLEIPIPNRTITTTFI